MIPESRIITYSLLAHINDHTPGLNDLSDVLQPLVEHALCKMLASGITHALLTDLKEQMDALYHFDIPFPTLTSILKKVELNPRNRDRKSINVHDDNSFALLGGGLATIDDAIAEQEGNLRYIERLYSDYVEDNSQTPLSEASLYAFLDQHRAVMSKFFSQRVEFEGEVDFTLQAMFVNVMRDNPRAFDILRSVYLGSIVAGYLEMEVGEIQVKGVELLLDTNFIISLIGLRSEESEDTCVKVVEIGKRLGYTFTTLMLTLDETRNLLSRTADTMHTSFFMPSLAPNSIEAGCAKRGLRETDVQRMGRELDATLTKRYGIKIVELDDRFMKAATESKVYARAKRRKFNRAGAHHDGIACYYVQRKRGQIVRRFNESKCWFVGDSLYDKDWYLEEGQYLPEGMQADYLVNILWLCNPRVDPKEMSKTALTKLVTSTLAKSMPDPAVLHQLDNNIRKYAVEKISPEELAQLSQLGT